MPEFPIVIAYVVISTTDKNDDANKPRLAPDRRGQNTIVQGVSLAHHCLAMSGMLLMELLAPIATGNGGGSVTTVEHSPKGMVFNFDH